MTPVSDPGARLAAARLQAAHPAWLILWGRYDRQFWAFPLFGAASGTLSGADPADLADRMRAAEIAAQPGRLPPLPDLATARLPAGPGNR